MACVTACPSGVRYDRLIERVRPQVERHHERSARRARAAAAALRDPPPPRAGCGRWRRCWRRAAACGADRALPGRLADPGQGRAPHHRGQRRCAPTRRASPRPSARPGAASGCCSAACSGSSTPTCTGPRSPCWPPRALRSWPRAPRTAAGRWSCTAGPRSAARSGPARRSTPSPGPGVDHVIVNAAGCGSAMKEYGDLLGHRRGARLLGHGARRHRAAGRDRAARPARSGPAAGRLPRRLPSRPRPGHPGPAARSAARRSPASSCSSRPSRDLCCGSAGIYNLVQPEAAAELGARKARNLSATGAQAIAAANPGCAAQLDLHLASSASRCRSIIRSSCSGARCGRRRSAR